MSHPDWVRPLLVRHAQLVAQTLLGSLRAPERLEYTRLAGLLDAWQAWDCHGNEALLTFKLGLRSLEAEDACHAR